MKGEELKEQGMEVWSGIGKGTNKKNAKKGESLRVKSKLPGEKKKGMGGRESRWGRRPENMTN